VNLVIAFSSLNGPITKGLTGQINPGKFRSKINAWSQGNRHPVTKISQEARNFSLVNDVPMHLSRRTLSEPAQAVMMLQAPKPAEGCIELTICLG
jgi:hypothetical protein